VLKRVAWGELDVLILDRGLDRGLFHAVSF
jgi:hypothetical protein